MIMLSPSKWSSNTVLSFWKGSHVIISTITDDSWSCISILPLSVNQISYPQQEWSGLGHRGGSSGSLWCCALLALWAVGCHPPWQGADGSLCPSPHSSPSLPAISPAYSIKAMCQTIAQSDLRPSSSYMILRALFDASTVSKQSCHSRLVCGYNRTAGISPSGLNNVSAFLWKATDTSAEVTVSYSILGSDERYGKKKKKKSLLLY